MRYTSILLASAACCAVAGPALAQQAATPAASAATPQSGDDQGIGDIIVTAQKRAQNLQDVPVSVTALTSEALANQRINDFADLTRAAASLTVTQQTASPNNSIILRGIGTFAFSIGVEPSVAVIVDDMPVVQQAQAFDNLGDIERIEVLKGPQGTLFGKNASAGVVNIVTKDPDKSFTGSAQVSAATDSDYRAEASVSAPIGDRSGIRVSAFYHNYDGNVRNLTTGTRLDDQEAGGVRAKLKLGLTDTLSFTLIGNYSKATQRGTGQTIRYLDPAGNPRFQGNAALPPLVPSLTGIVPGENNYALRTDVDGATTNTTATVSGKFALDLGTAQLISVTSYQDWKYNFQTDFDGSDIDILRVLTAGAQHGGIVQGGPYHSTDFTQELRVVSTGRSALKYLFGIFYSDADTTRTFIRGPVTSLTAWNGASTTNSIAAFGQVDYKLPTATTLSVGVRANREKIGVSFDNLLANATANTCAPGNPLCRGSNTDSVVTWKGSISQELAPRIMAYASVATGYKGYAYDVSSGFNPARINAALSGTGPGLVGVGPIKAETSTSYELGLKSRLFDNKVQLNVTGFYTDYNNFQAQSSVIVNGAPQIVLNNVGKLRTKGVELEFSAKPVRWLELQSSAAYTDAVMRSFPNAQAYSDQTGQVFANGASALVGNCTSAPAATAAAPRTICAFQDRSGASLPNSPRFKFNVGANADFPLGSHDTTGRISLSYQHQSDVNFDLLGNPLLVQKGYGVLNGGIGVTTGRWKVTVFVNNLFDKHYATYLADSFGNLGGSATNPAHVIYQVLPRDSQRYAGMKVGVNF